MIDDSDRLRLWVSGSRRFDRASSSFSLKIKRNVGIHPETRRHIPEDSRSVLKKYLTSLESTDPLPVAVFNLFTKRQRIRLCFFCSLQSWTLRDKSKEEKRLCYVMLCYVMLCMLCGRVPAANAPGCTAAEGLLYKPWSLVVPTCTARCLHQRP